MHLVVFDIDGTLTDTNLVDGICYWRAVCEVLGLAGEQPDWAGFRHVTDAGIAAELCARHLGRQASSAEIEALEERLVAHLEAALDRDDPAAYQIPGSAEILSVLGKSADFAVALATGGLRSSAELKLRRAGLPRVAMPLATSNDAIAREDILRIAASQAGGKNRFARFTYVGDGVWDVKAAREMGWEFIGIGSGEHAQRLRQAGARIIVPDYRPVEAFMELLVDHNRARIS